MKPRVSTCQIPASSAIAQQLAGAYFSDCFELAMPVPVLAANEPSAMELYLNVVSKTPQWVNVLMAMRNKFVSHLGLKSLGHLGELNTAKPASAYRVGDRVGIFSLLYVTENEIILGDSDKHLDVKVSLSKQIYGEHKSASLSTVVHIHNTLGRVYMFFVAPVHKIIAPAVLTRMF